ncbi:MAG: cation diffusion facilitator family transporter [Gammaproteobacteria bacterium]|nr:cation diffusion facilitator family transporter [Gammaproteobacteria bacterium]
MAHGHDHGQVHGGQQALARTLLLTGCFMVVEVIGGLLSGSLALLADAGHMLTDTGALALAWLGFEFGRRDPDARRSFGYARFEVLAGLVNALTMIAVVIFIVFEAFERLGDPQPVLAGPMLAVAVGGLAVNLIAFRLLHGDADHVNVRGALVHVMGDLLGSVAAIIAAVVILAGGWTGIDPLLSMVVAALVLRSALSLLRQTAHILLEGTPEEIDAESLGSELARRVRGVRDVHHVHIWSLSSGRNLATMHVRVNEDHEKASILRAIKSLLRERFGLEHTTVQICPEPCPDEHAERPAGESGSPP